MRRACDAIYEARHGAGHGAAYMRAEATRGHEARGKTAWRGGQVQTAEGKQDAAKGVETGIVGNGLALKRSSGQHQKRFRRPLRLRAT